MHPAAAIYYLDDFSCGEDRFQDGAVVANNPAVVALQEARLLWPDTPIDVFVSLGTGSTPCGRRDKGLSSLASTLSVLIESTTCVDRAHEALATMLPMVPNLRYFRFNPEDVRCGMELDEVNPAKWALLEEATEDYVNMHSEEFDRAAAALSMALEAPSGRDSSTQLRLGSRRGILVIGAAVSLAEPRAADIAAAACAHLPTCIKAVDLQAVPLPSMLPAPASSAVTRHAEPMQVQSHPVALEEEPSPQAGSSPSGAGNIVAFPSAASQGHPTATVEVDLGSAFGSVLNWFSPGGKQSGSGRVSPRAESLDTQLVGQTAAPAAVEEEIACAPVESRPITALGALERALTSTQADVGIVHLGLHPSTSGLVMRWQEHVEALTEPSKNNKGVAHLFRAAGPELFIVVFAGPAASLLVGKAGHDPATITLAELFQQGGSLDAGDSEVRLLSRQTQRVNGQQLSVFLVQPIRPAAILDVDAIKSLHGLVTKQLIVCSANLEEHMVLAWLRTGALAVVCGRPDGRRGTLEQAGGRALASFWTSFYGALHQGTPLMGALRQAGVVQPALQSAFVVYALEAAQLVQLHE